MLVPWIQENIQVVSQLLIIDLWNQKILKKENVIVAIEGIFFRICDDFQDFLISFLSFLN